MERKHQNHTRADGTLRKKKEKQSQKAIKTMLCVSNIAINHNILSQ